MTSAKDKYNSLLRAGNKLIVAVKGERIFPTANYIQTVKEERRYSKKDRDAANDARLQGIISNQGALERRILLHAKYTGPCISVWGTTVTGTVLTAT